MSKEWGKKNEFNSFNSWKGLLYAPWYEGVRDHKLWPPVEASLDPIHACNLMCNHCNATRYLIKAVNKMPDDHLMELIIFLEDWGVKAICFGGGGEPTLHKALPKALRLTKELGLGASIATNGTMFNSNLINAMASTCRWVGVSVDAATAKTYKIGRRSDCFDITVDNISKLVKVIKKKKSKCEVAYKFLIFNYNEHEIYKACKLAKSLGVKDFHARPADLTHQGMDKSNKTWSYDKEKIERQFKKCHKLETKDFRIFTIVHKFNDTLKPRKDFSQCYASPLCIQLCADGNVYLCPDQRHNNKYKLGTHYPEPNNILNFWGGSKHQKLIYKTGKKSCKTRCTFMPYNRQCEALFIKKNDPMCWRFI